MDLWLMNADGSDDQQLTFPAHIDKDGKSRDWEGEARWTAEGTSVAYAAHVDNQRFIYASGPVCKEQNCDQSDSQYELYVYQITADTITRMTTNDQFDDEPQWSPLDNRVVFTRRVAGRPQLYILNLDTMKETPIPTNDVNCCPSWKLDGTKILFTRTELANKVSSVWQINPDGTGAEKLTNPQNGDYDGSASFSPDGGYVAFTRFYAADGGYPDIWLLEMKPGFPKPETPITKTPTVAEQNPVWRTTKPCVVAKR